MLSELVGNVVRHARTPMRITLTLQPPYLHLAVADGSRSRGLRAQPDLAAEGGRGLMLSASWPSAGAASPLADGKVVWASCPRIDRIYPLA